METIVKQLLSSNEPSIRYKTLTGVYGLSEDHTLVRETREQIRNCDRVKALLSHRNKKGEFDLHPYKKWHGAHWILSMLAELGYPGHDSALIPLREQVFTWLFSKDYQKNIRLVDGRIRHCASMEGNAALSLMKLGLGDERIDELIHHLVEWQWPDGGWNCDRNPKANHSSFMESWLPLRAMAYYGESRKDQSTFLAIEHGCELFLSHELYKRSSDGSIILKEFLRLRYPRYWHYDILAGLITISEAGRLSDKRCRSALQLLTDRMKPSTGFDADGRYYQLHHKDASGYSPVNWNTGGKGQRKASVNEFLTVEALTVLRKADMLPKLVLDA